MWEWIAPAIKWVGGLFSSKGKSLAPTGNENQASTSSATGAGSTAISAGRDAAGRDIIYHALPPIHDPDVELFAQIERDMPELLAELRKDLAEHPMIRDIIAMPTSGMIHNWPTMHSRFYENQQPGVMDRMGILVDHGLLERHKSEYAYRITPKLASYLRKPR